MLKNNILIVYKNKEITETLKKTLDLFEDKPSIIVDETKSLFSAYFVKKLDMKFYFFDYSNGEDNLLAYLSDYPNYFSVIFFELNEIVSLSVIIGISELLKDGKFIFLYNKKNINLEEINNNFEHIESLIYINKDVSKIELKKLITLFIKKTALSNKAKNIDIELKKEVKNRTKQLKNLVQDLLTNRDKLKEEMFSRQLFEKELETEKDNLYFILEHIDEGVIITDNYGFITKTNKKILSMFKLETNLNNYTHIDDFLLLRTKNNLQILPYTALLETNTDYINQSVLLKLNDKEIPVNVTFLPLKNKENNFLGLFFLIKEITCLNRISENSEISTQSINNLKADITTNKNILIVSKDNVIRTALAKTLNFLGNVVHTETNLEDIVAIYTTINKITPIDHVIVDIRINDFNNIDISTIKKYITASNFILLTSDRDSESTLEYKKIGFDNVLIKPFLLADLQNVLV